MFRLPRWLIAVLVSFALVATACGGSDRSEDATATDTAVDNNAVDNNAVDNNAADDTTAPTDSPEPDSETPEPDTPDTTEPEAVDPCEGVTLEATDIGVTADTITVVAMADVGSPLAPGLFQGAWDGVNAWAKYVNANGGLACRQIEVIEADSMLNPTDTTNGFLRACESALALVGTTVLFANDVSDLNSCANADGEPIGVPDLAYLGTEANHACSATSFHMARPGAACPYESGLRDHTGSTSFPQWALDNISPDLTGIYMVPGDLPSTISASIPIIKAGESAGINYLATPAVSGRATQAEYGPHIQLLSEGQGNYVYNGSNDAAMIAMRKEAAAQGLDIDSITWACFLSCYTPNFIEQGGADVENTYVTTDFVPFFEAQYNDELAAFMDNIGDDFPPTWAASAWASGQLFTQVVNDIVATEGPNAVTRASVLDGLRGVETFDVNGWWGDVDFTTTNTVTSCMVVLQVKGGEFVRVFPEEPGTIACDPDQLVALQVDPADFEG